MKQIIIFLLIFFTNYTFGQQIQYVNAENGLIIRKKPKKSSQRIGKLEYGSKVYILKETENSITIKDGDKLIKGNWVNIEEIDKNIKGFVFNGFLTQKKINKKTELKFKDLSLKMEIEIWDKTENFKKNIVKVSVALGDSPEGKIIKVNQSKFKKIEIFQCYENSITIMNEGPHCDLIKWKKYYSDWVKLKLNPRKNTFVLNSYNDKDREKFIKVNINELKNVVEKKCGKIWKGLIKDIKNVNEYPSGVSTSKIFLKILTTNENDLTLERIVEFEIPMGC